MNILLASVDALPRLGGVSLMAHHLANALARGGHRVVMLGPKGTHVPGDLDRSYLLCEDWESQTGRQAGPEATAEDTRIAALAKAVFRRYGIERVVLMHAFYYGPGIVEACRAARVPCSVMFHGLELRSQLRDGYPAAQNLKGDRQPDTLRQRTFRTIAECDELLANSRYTAGLLAPFHARAPIRVTGCGIEDAQVERMMTEHPRYDATAKRVSRRALGLPDAPTLAFVGRLVPNKRIDRLIDLVAGAQDLAGLVIGDGPLARSLQQQARVLGIQDRVQFTGAVSDQRKWQLLGASDAITLLSDDDPVRGDIEGFGIALLEGIAAACLPISSGTGGMVDIVTDAGGDGVIVPLDGDVAQQAAAVATLLADESRSAAIIARARHQMAQTYTWERIAARLVDGWASVAAAA